MTKKDLFDLRYFLILGTTIIGFYMYSGITGWKWVGGTKTEDEKQPVRQGYHRYYYNHK